MRGASEATGLQKAVVSWFPALSGMQGLGRSRGKRHCNEREGLKSEGEGSVQAFKGPFFNESVPVPSI